MDSSFWGFTCYIYANTKYEIMSNFASIVAKYLSGKLTEEEKKELEERLAQSEEERRLFERILKEKFPVKEYREYAAVDVERAIREFNRRTGRRIARRVARWGAAAAVVAGLAVGGWHYYYGSLQEEERVEVPVAQTIVAGSSKALLTLASGEVIDLASVQNKKLDKHFLNNEDGRLTYRKGQQEKIVYNTLQIPLGGEYELELSDGTVINLNSGTKIKYPVTFGDGERSVELLYGEAYFSVAHSSIPFHVKVRGMNIQVYGTEFNVNTYTSNHIYTTLVKGKVGISYAKDKKEIYLKPCTQADFNWENKTVEVREVNPVLYVSWKEGRYVFHNERLENIMRTLGVWYNFKVVFADEKLKGMHFSGSMTRYDDISKITEAIAYSVGIQINIVDNTLYVKQK